MAFLVLTALSQLNRIFHAKISFTRRKGNLVTMAGIALGWMVCGTSWHQCGWGTQNCCAHGQRVGYSGLFGLWASCDPLRRSLGTLPQPVLLGSNVLRIRVGLRATPKCKLAFRLLLVPSSSAASHAPWTRSWFASALNVFLFLLISSQIANTTAWSHMRENLSHQMSCKKDMTKEGNLKKM